MEKGLDILNMFSSAKPIKIKYFAEYNSETGEIIKVGPEHAFTGVDRKIEIEEDFAISILKGETRFNKCYVDIVNNQLLLTEDKNVVGIDDLLHRIVDEKWADHDDPYIFLTYNKKNKSIKIEMTEKYYGTKKWPKKYDNFTKRRVHWAGESIMNFIVTEYNDPTIIFGTFSVSANDLVDKSVTIQLEDFDKEDFSIFTRRIFKNYSIKIK